MAKLKYIIYSLVPVVSILGVLGLSWLLAAFIEIYTHNLTMLKIFDQSTKYETKHKVAQPPFPGNKKNNIFWFVQISDIHISQFRSYGQVEDLLKFCETTLKNINPEIVLMTGDITDAKDVLNIGSSQYTEEWETYSSVLKTCVHEGLTWLDIRGNHDAFAVPSLHGKHDLFNKFASSKNKFDDSYVYQHVHATTFGNYSFNGVDFAPNPGPARPFNFFGVPDQKTINRLQEISTTNNNYNATIWFGHYPLSTTTKPHILRKLLSSGIVYLCGHLHTLLGVVPQMHAIHTEGLLELELGDWKENRKYRIGVFDHDMFSFADATYSSDEHVVVFTNPVDAKYMVPGESSYLKSRNSTHIRFLLFSDTHMRAVQVYVDDAILCPQTEVIDNLHTCRWSPSKYQSGVHEIKVIVVNKEKNSTATCTFSLDGTRPPLSFLSVIILVTDFCTMSQMVYLVAIFTTILFPMLLKKCAHQYHIDLCRSFLKMVSPQIIYFVDCDRVFWPLIYYNCHLSVGPISVGYFIPDQLGVFFSFGLYSGGHHIPGSFTYLYVGAQLLLYNALIMIYVGELLNKTTDISLTKLFSSNKHRTRTIFFHLLLVFLIWNQLSSSYMFYVAYGALSCVINPVKTWTMPLSVYLIYKATTCKRKR
ncbi:transmembrane protein 62-like [Hydractinia symbiolongicarpus]|uniref:transmembrane protein 62-like n=1 Tax=Hydractinia symbiolongicarpus TaxID=13093 RepID=UPI00254F25CC|nr:transmembrane protein 62-like [Hydractinia symbiolongicarpus]